MALTLTVLRITAAGGSDGLSEHAVCLLDAGWLGFVEPRTDLSPRHPVHFHKLLTQIPTAEGERGTCLPRKGASVTAPSVPPAAHGSNPAG